MDTEYYWSHEPPSEDGEKTHEDIMLQFCRRFHTLAAFDWWLLSGNKERRKRESGRTNGFFSFIVSHWVSSQRRPTCGSAYRTAALYPPESFLRLPTAVHGIQYHFFLDFKSFLCRILFYWVFKFIKYMLNCWFYSTVCRLK